MGCYQGPHVSPKNRRDAEELGTVKAVSAMMCERRDAREGTAANYGHKPQDAGRHSVNLIETTELPVLPRLNKTQTHLQKYSRTLLINLAPCDLR